MQNHWKLLFLPTCLLLLLWACNQPVNVPPINNPDDLEGFLTDSLGIDSCIVRDTVGLNTLPSAAQSYLSTNYPQDTLVNVILYQTGTDSLFQADLNSGNLVLFDGMGNFIQDGNPRLIDPSTLTDSLLDTLNFYFPGLNVEEVELEWSYNGMQALEIELDSDIELYVFVSANSICFVVDDDDYSDCDDDDHYIPADSLSAAIIQYIDSVYPNARIEGCVELETFCDSIDVYHVEIEKPNGEDVYLVFGLNDDFLHELAEAELSALPSAVQNSISTDYPGFVLEDEIHILTRANGDLLYQV